MNGLAELAHARRQCRALYWAVALFSLIVNILMLSGPLYMLNVYDRVLGSGSVETLVALSLLVGFLYACMAVLDHVRGRIMARAAAQFQSTLDRRVFEASLSAAKAPRTTRIAATALQDLEAIQKLFASPALLAAFDLPFMPVFFAGIFIFHPALGWLALGGAVLLAGTTIANHFLTKAQLVTATRSLQQSELMGHTLRLEAETIHALGMRQATFSRWKEQRERSLLATLAASDTGGLFSAVAKSLRLLLQSAMLGLGAWLALKGEISPGSMIAGSILMGRALAPVEMIVGSWSMFERGRSAWRNLAELLTIVPPQTTRTALPRPRAILEASALTVVPPGDSMAALRMVSFRIEPGHAVGIIGPSGAGKSTLARAITGIWAPAGGKIRLDGASLEQYDPDVLGQHIGYLPQRIQLIDGTIAENIARMATDRNDDAVVEAARKAGAHEMILKLPEGYDTKVTASGGRLSGGQLQRIGLARAMYGNPVFLVLDEPNSNLDNDGSIALNEAIQAFLSADNSVLIMAHRPAAIQHCDQLMVIEGGTLRAFGPKDEIMRSMLKNHQEIRQSSTPGGIA